MDNCCYNRPFDDQSQLRIRKETDAISAITNQALANEEIILGSDILLFEIGKIKNPDKKADVFSAFNKFVKEKIPVNAKIFQRANELMNDSNVKEMDAAHLACAEFGNADIFLTTDDKLIKACKNLPLKLKVLNPISYLEVIKNDEH